MKQPRMIGAVSFVAKEYPFPVVCLRPAHVAFPVTSWPIFALAPPGALIAIAGHDFAGQQSMPVSCEESESVDHTNDGQQMEVHGQIMNEEL